MEKVTGYVYSIETMEVIAEITGETREIEKYVDENYDTDTCGLTFSPAFGINDGLIDVVDSRKDFIDLQISAAAAALGEKGGKSKSPKKAASSRENGKRGGRPVEKKTYWILSGEGENGTWEKHIATLTGIKRIATKERCGGDRWAQIWEEIPETDTTEAHICNIDDGDMRDVPDED